MTQRPVVVVGAGPAGLTAAYELVRQGIRPLVVEQSSYDGGIARTEVYKDFRFDIGGHRFYTKVGEVERLWHELLGSDFRRVPRLSRIYYRGRFYQYPLEIANTLGNLGIGESARIILSYARARLLPLPNEETLEQWVINRFGQRLYRTFFKAYTEKVWGIPCDQIQAEWAAQRIRGLSLLVAVSNALFGSHQTKTLIDEFHYPRLGPGMMWERCREAIERLGGEVWMETSMRQMRHEDGRITGVVLERQGERIEVDTNHVISSAPITQLVRCIEPTPPAEVLAAAGALKYRAFILVGLILNRSSSLPDNWIYVHSPEVKVGRIQNFKNWSADMVPDPGKTSLGMEYFCDEDDGIWRQSDIELIALAGAELEQLGLGLATEVEDGIVIRQAKAYPVYDQDYRRHLATLKHYLVSFRNLQTCGRNGMHRYNNQDHSMLTGMLAAGNVIGAAHDLWEVNTERSYYEDFSTPAREQMVSGTTAGSNRPFHRAKPAPSDSAAGN